MHCSFFIFGNKFLTSQQLLYVKITNTSYDIKEKLNFVIYLTIQMVHFENLFSHQPCTKTYTFQIFQTVKVQTSFLTLEPVIEKPYLEPSWNPWKLEQLHLLLMTVLLDV